MMYDSYVMFSVSFVLTLRFEKKELSKEAVLSLKYSVYQHLNPVSGMEGA